MTTTDRCPCGGAHPTAECPRRKEYERREAEGRAKRAGPEMLEVMERLLSHYTTKPHCGHTYTCVCKDKDINDARALVARTKEG